ncbi:hypothetical protein GGI13_003906 [Coemansia sp. RSA 455]|nr:hypothetical protein GGI13_003906 [Coemansia sp. RSA 455]
MTNDNPPIEYQLTIIQQPELSMVISSSQRDRRCIEPCPVIQVQMIRPDRTEVDIDVGEEYVMCAQLYKENGEEPVDTAEISMAVGGDQQGTNFVKMPLKSPLSGTTLSSHNRVKALSDEPVTVFCFPDLRSWIDGRFRLRFALFYLPKGDSPLSRPTSFMASVMSDKLTIYTQKEFPGVYESTPLSKKLNKQGILIPIRNRNRLRNNDEESSANIEIEYSDQDQDA